jgi:DNA helicase II / ATP-dependent DNA helicase PcrA
MQNIKSLNPAEVAAAEAIKKVFSCIEEKKSFVLEAGAGAGKTHSLVQALNHLLENVGQKLLRNKQRIACITYTNVASKEIASRTNSHPAIYSATIHAFCWDLVKDFQPELQKLLPSFGKWQNRIVEAGIERIGHRKILYDLGYPKIEDHRIWVGHNDVLLFIVELMKLPKFRAILSTRFPIIFIDEYQDTENSFAEALKTYFFETKTGPIIGFFGDHWQKIYGTGCGKIEHSNIETISKKANFRSAKEIVECLNKIRKELPQEISDSTIDGNVSVYHTNDWIGTRRSGAHWKGDLPEEDAHKCLTKLKSQLTINGWNFTDGKSKILMLTHNVLAGEQGYKNLLDVFDFKDSLIKKEDSYISFLVDTVEPICQAYEKKKYGEMFDILDKRTPIISSHAVKADWVKDMNDLLVLRQSATIGEVIDHLKQTKKPRLSAKVEQREKELEEHLSSGSPEVQNGFNQILTLKSISYKEIIEFGKFVEEKSPFATKHGVKGAEFENVLVVLGRGWNTYNFNDMLEWASKGAGSNQDSFERNRNLFYVACSRPRKRLSLLFTQKLSDDAIGKLGEWFGQGNIKSIVP